MHLALAALLKLYELFRQASKSLGGGGVALARGRAGERDSKALQVGAVLQLCARQQEQFCSLTRELSLVDLAPVMSLQTFISPDAAAAARRQLKDYGAVLACRKRVLQASHDELERTLGRVDGRRLAAYGTAGRILTNHRRACSTLFEDLNAAQTKVYATMSAAADWMMARRWDTQVVTDAGVELSEMERQALSPMLTEILEAQKRSHELLIQVLQVQAETLALVKRMAS